MTDSRSVTQRGHPGQGKKRSRPTPKGRQVEPTAMREIEALLGDEPIARDRLIEHLHRIQDRYGCLAERHLAALAETHRVPMAEVFEVATFYAHFDVVGDDYAPAEVTVRVCDSLSCWLRGAKSLKAALGDAVEAQQLSVRVVNAPCMGRCDRAPVAEVGHRHIESASVDHVLDAIRSESVEPEIPEFESLDAYRSAGGYAHLVECREGKHSVEDVIELVSEAGLRGLGGAGFPSGRKWSIVRSFPGPRLMAVNADEGEPGTFKDRVYLEQRPHRFLEGLLIAAWATDAQRVYIYLRDEYPGVRQVLLGELSRLETAGVIPPGYIDLRRGAGAYICGEESAMLESIEGKRGLPRHRPPYVAEVGLFGRPTLVHNVETLYWLPELLARGAQWFATQGVDGGKGLRSYSVSGRVRSPGVKLAPAGVSARVLIDDYCGGMEDGHVFKGFLPGGASGGILPASMADLPLEFGALERYGCFVGSHAVVVLSDHDNMGEVALNLMRFFEDESCGQCTPCRVGTEKAVALMSEGRWDTERLRELAQAMADASICGLGQAAANPVLRVLEHFPEDVTH